MAVTYDTLTYGVTEKAFADWGLSLNSIQGKKRIGSDDTFTVTIVNTTIAAEADAPTFAFEGQIVVRVNRTLSLGVFSGGVIKFVGKRIGQPVRATSGGQGVTYTFQGPWYDLSNTNYLQPFQGNAAKYFLPEVVLNVSTATTISPGWLVISVGDQIQAILQFILDQYAAQSMAAPFQYKARSLHAGAIDLTVTGTTGTPGGDYSIAGYKYAYLLQAGMSIDTTLFSLFLPSFIQKPMQCAQALMKCLELSPRVSVWFDYSTVDGGGNPLPTIRFDLIESRTAVSLPLFTGAMYDGTVSHKEVRINPRPELQLRAAVIKYRITNTISGVKVIDYAIDKWSAGGSNVNLDGLGDNINNPNAGIRVMNELIDVQGYIQQTQQGHLDLEILGGIGGTQATKRAWWSSKRGGEIHKLSDSRVRFQDKTGSATTIPDAKYYYSTAGLDSVGASVAAGQEFTADDYAYYGYRVVRGTFHAWFKQGSTVIKTVKCIAVSKMTFAEYDCASALGTEAARDTDRSGHVHKKANTSEHHCNLELTNAIPDSGTSGYANFDVLGSFTAGETYLIGAGGIAQYLYNHFQVLQFEGEYVSVAANFVNPASSQYITLGNRLNLTGGATLWTTMNAQVQEISEDYGTHRTSVVIGVSRFLNAGQLFSLFNMWRNRRPWYNPALVADNSLASANAIDMSKSTGTANTTEGVDTHNALTLLDYSSAPSGTTPGVANSKSIFDAGLVTSNAGLN